MQQKSTTIGQLFMAATSIGNPLDIPQRSLNALRESDLLVFEEDRPARAALKAAGIHREYLKYNEHQQVDTIEAIREAFLKGQKVCYMSDQGMPVIADPGSQILSLAYSLNVKVTIIPGPSSITAALAACPFIKDRFEYVGFLERDTLKRHQQIKKLSEINHPLIILDTPYRRVALLESLAEGFGSRRNALLASDISGEHEDYYLDTLNNLSKLDLGKKLNFVLIVDGQKTK